MMGRRGLQYGPAFQNIRELWRGLNEVVALLHQPPMDEDEAEYRLHPALLDAAFQALAGAIDPAETRGT